MLLADRFSGLDEGGKMPGNLAMAATGEQSDDPGIDGDGKSRAKFRAAERWLHQPRERVADVSGWHAPALEEILLEGEDTQKPFDRGAHRSDPSLAPSPGLGRDEVHHRDTGFAEAL